MKQIATLFLLAIVGCIPIAQSVAQATRHVDRIPKDLKISLSMGGTVQFSSHYVYTITVDGRVFYEETQSGLPPPRAVTGIWLGGKGLKAIKPPELPDKLSAKQLKILANRFVDSGFLQMKDRYEGEPDEKGMVTCINHAEEKGLSFSSNGKTKNVSVFLGCSYGENSPVKGFLDLYDEVNKVLRTVKSTPIKKP